MLTSLHKKNIKDAISTWEWGIAILKSIKARGRKWICPYCRPKRKFVASYERKEDSECEHELRDVDDEISRLQGEVDKLIGALHEN